MSNSNSRCEDVLNLMQEQEKHVYSSGAGAVGDSDFLFRATNGTEEPGRPSHDRTDHRSCAGNSSTGNQKYSNLQDIFDPMTPSSSYPVLYYHETLGDVRRRVNTRLPPIVSGPTSSDTQERQGENKNNLACPVASCLRFGDVVGLWGKHGSGKSMVVQQWLAALYGKTASGSDSPRSSKRTTDQLRGRCTTSSASFDPSFSRQIGIMNRVEVHVLDTDIKFDLTTFARHLEKSTATCSRGRHHVQEHYGLQHFFVHRILRRRDFESSLDWIMDNSRKTSRRSSSAASSTKIVVVDSVDGLLHLVPEKTGSCAAMGTAAQEHDVPTAGIGSGQLNWSDLDTMFVKLRRCCERSLLIFTAKSNGFFEKTRYLDKFFAARQDFQISVK
ncbi:unnamed protein product [Amoebophrya sp. A120]|nr:unnamed protein product [Amoebophrya sp. A120]|eukprot:GSA120T00008172001.1